MRLKETILNSLKPILEDGGYVSIDKETLSKLARKLLNMPLPPWDNQMQFLGSEEDTIQYYFIVDSINFCYWHPQVENKWRIKFKGTWLDGYFAYSCVLKEAFEKKPNFKNPKNLAKISYNEFSAIFQGRGELLLLKERWNILRENLAILNKKYQGKAVNLVKNTDCDAAKLVFKLVKEFPTFDDSAVFKGNKLLFYKRAQIFVNDINFALDNKGLGYFKNMEELTAFADYKLPQLLQKSGVMSYRQDLLDKITNGVLITPGTVAEIEIRAKTIFACELIAKEMRKLGRKINTNQLDWLLWVLAKETKFKLPYHKTLTTFY